MVQISNSTWLLCLLAYLDPLNIDLIQPVEKGSANFNDLVLPELHRRLVESLVKTHHRGAKPTSGNVDVQNSFDIVRSKGSDLT